MALAIQAVVSLDTKMFTSGLRGLEASVNQFAGLVTMQFGGIAQQISAMWGAFGPAGAAVSALGAVTQAGAEFEQQMARVASYTGMAGEEIEALSRDSMQLAGDYGFSAKEIGGALANLALAGIDTKEALGDVLRPSLMLAKATLGDTQQAAEAITSTLKVFQLEMDQATHVADMFAGAIASSPLDMQRLTDAMKYAGPAGSAFGMAMEQVIKEVSALHLVGQRGQMAGTVFRGAIMEMAKAARSGAGEVGRALAGWDVATEGLTGAVRRLNDAGVDTAVVIEEVGKRAGPGVAALMKLGAAAMDDLSAKVERNADVHAMFEKQVQTLQGQFDIFKGKVVALGQEIFTKLAPGLGECVDLMKDAVDGAQKFGKSIGGIGDGISKALPLILRLSTALLAINGTIRALNAVGLATGGNSLAGILRSGPANLAARQQAMSAAQAASAAAKAKLDAAYAKLQGMNATAGAYSILGASTSNKAWASAYMKLHQGSHLGIDEAATRGMKEFARVQEQLAKQGPKLNAAIQKQTAAIAAQNAAYTQAAASAGVLKSGVSGLGVAMASLGVLVLEFSLADWFFKSTEAGKQLAEVIREKIIPGYKEAKEAEAAWSRELMWQQEQDQMRAEARARGENWGKNETWRDVLEGHGVGTSMYDSGAITSMGWGRIDFEAFDRVAKEYQSAMAAFEKAQNDSVFEFSAEVKRAIPNVSAYAVEIEKLAQSGKISADSYERLTGQMVAWGRAVRDAQKPIEEEQRNLEKLRQKEAELFQERQQLEAAIKYKEETVGEGDIGFRGLQWSLAAAREELDKIKTAQTTVADSIEASQGKIRESLQSELDIRQDIEREIRAMQEAETKRLEAEQEAQDEAIGKREQLRDTIKNTTLSIEAAQKATNLWGDDAALRVDALTKKGHNAEEVVKWIAGDLDNLKQVFAALTGEAGNFDDEVVKYGKDLINVLALAEREGITREEAYERIKDAAEKAADSTSTLDEETLKLGDHFAGMSEDQIQKYVDGLTSIRDALKNAGFDQKQNFDIGWLKDLSGFKMPNLKHISEFTKADFGKIGEIAEKLKGNGIKKEDLEWLGELGKLQIPKLTGKVTQMDFIVPMTNLANTMADVAKLGIKAEDLSWLTALSSFKIPSGDFTGFANGLKELANTINSLQIDSENLGFLGKLADIANMGNATITLKSDETLDSIDKSLQKLAELKGVVWV